MLKRIERQKALEEFKVLPFREYDCHDGEEGLFYSQVCQSYVLTISSKYFSKQVGLMGVELARLATKLGMGELFFLGDTKVGWLYQDNDYKPVKRAQAFFVSYKIGKRFNGALQVDTLSLPYFISNVAWLIRCNAALPNIYFTDQGQHIIGSICRYGNLHLDLLNEETDRLLRSLLPQTRFQQLDTNSCFDRYGQSNAIKGRRTL